jgi:hypothetical protein
MRMRPILPAARWLLALAATAPAVAQAQVSDSVGTAADTTVASGRRYEVSALAGYQWFDKAAALRGTPTIGLRVVHPAILSRLPGLTVGANAAVARPNTRGDYFPWNRQIYYSSDATRRNDTTLVYEVSQQVTMAWLGVDVGYRFGGLPNGAAMRSPTDWRAIQFDASVGAGVYGFWLDPEQTRRNERHARRGWLLGGGLAVPLRGDTRLVVRAEDLVFVWFDRNWFSLHDPLFAEELWRNPVKTPPPFKGTVHNARLTVQFSFVPGGTVTP